MLAARAGRFGAGARVISERHMRSHDGRTAERARRYGVRLGGVGPGGRDCLHYPDLVLVTDTGHRGPSSSSSRPRRWPGASAS